MAKIKNITFSAAAGQWLESVKPRVKPTSYAQYTVKLEKNILPYFGGAKLNEITADRLKEFEAFLLGEGLTKQYTYDILIQIKMITKYISRAYGCPDPAMNAVFMRPKQELRTGQIYDEIYCGHLFRALTENPDLTKAGILLTLFAGLKIGELCALKWENIDLDNGLLIVANTLQRISAGNNTGVVLTKLNGSSRVRTVPLAKFLQDILKRFQTNGNSFFLSGTNSPIEPRTMQYRLRSFLKKEELPYISFSELRKLFINRCVSRGADIAALSEILGNATVQSAVFNCPKPTMDSKIRAVELVAQEVS